MPSRLLLVEDDPDLGAQLVQRFKDAGYEPLWWSEGKRIYAKTFPEVDLVVLDLMLPGVYGMDMLKELRTFSDVPVLVLSARSDSADKVRALKLGADDYMTKPFWPAELIERVRARLRRPVLARAQETVVDVLDLRIDRGAREIRLRGERIDVTRLEFDFLSALAERPGAAMTRAWLAERVLDPERDGNERTLDVHVSRLRKKLGGGTYIETVWGIGYRLRIEPHAGERRHGRDE